MDHSRGLCSVDSATLPRRQVFQKSSPRSHGRRRMASEPLTSVHPQETNEWVPSAFTEEHELHRADDPSSLYRHAGWQPQRTHTRAALVLAGTRPRRLLDFDLCGCGAWLLVDKDDDSRHTISTRTCHNRWCLPCARTRSFKMCENLRRKLSQTTSRKIELTLKSTDEPLERQMDRLWDSFKVLRKTALWKDNVAGGLAVFEVTHNATTGLWHPHLHILYIGNWIDKPLLVAEWRRITGDSFILKISLVGDASRVAHYVTKYITKPCPSAKSMPLEALAELITTFHGRRLLTTFGNWRGFRLNAKLDNTEWICIGPLDTVLSRIRFGDLDLSWRLRRLGNSDRDLLRACVRPPPTD